MCDLILLVVATISIMTILGSLLVPVVHCCSHCYWCIVVGIEGLGFTDEHSPDPAKIGSAHLQKQRGCVSDANLLLAMKSQKWFVGGAKANLEKARQVYCEKAGVLRNTGAVLHTNYKGLLVIVII